MSRSLPFALVVLCSACLDLSEAGRTFSDDPRGGGAAGGSQASAGGAEMPLAGGSEAGNAGGGATAGGATAGGATAGGATAGGASAGGGGALWSDPSLSALSVTPGALSFAPATTMYAVTVPRGTSQVVLTPSAVLGARVSLKVNGTASGVGVAVAVPLGGAVSTITLVVTAESGATRTYTVVVSVGLNQQALLKAAAPAAGARFGFVLALSSDGNTLAVGAPGDSGGGAVYVFARSGGAWVQQARLTGAYTEAGDSFGAAVALSADGSTLATSAPHESSSATGVNGNENNNSAASAGAVYVFTRSGSTWARQAFLKASNAEADDQFGFEVRLSADGNLLVTSAYGEDSGGGQSGNAQSDAGAVYAFVRNGSTWSQNAYLKAPVPHADDSFGYALAVDPAGTVLAVGAVGDDGAAGAAGAVYVFQRTATSWTTPWTLRATNAGAGDGFGSSVAFDGSGTLLAIGAVGEASNARGVDGDMGNESMEGAGAVYLFSRSGSVWSQQHYFKASNADASDLFGSAVALSSDGSALLISAMNEASGGPGVDANASDNSAAKAGAAYLFERSGSTWSQASYVKASNPDANDQLGGWSVGLSADGKTLALGAVGEASASAANPADNSLVKAGAVYVFGR
ncbi:MAG: cadherin-like beta sandwich domain-containing protein [Archangiaceae bacterium]|nr:cadherin-like beta sandwich domain-containing protein [Archangiaceae bacterium]